MSWVAACRPPASDRLHLGFTSFHRAHDPETNESLFGQNFSALKLFPTNGRISADGVPAIDI
jgi:hypothetical protein